MPLRGKLILFVITLLIITTLAITLVWYHDTNSTMNFYTEEMASLLMKDAYNAFSYLLTDADYLSSLVIINKENIIIPLQIINDEAKNGKAQFTYNQLVNKRLIDSYIGSMYGHKYYITGISVASTSGYLFKIGEALYYPYDLIKKLKEYGVSESERRMILLPPVSFGSIRSKYQSQFVVPAVRNILSNAGDLVGYVIIYFDYAIIRDIFSNNLPRNSIFNVHDKLGNIIFSNTDNTTLSLNNNKQFYVQSHYFAEKAGWYFDMAIPTVEIRSRVNSTMHRTFVVLLIIALTAIILGILAVYRMTRNLEKLNYAMLEVSQGNLDFRAGIEGNDEIGKMGNIFNQMAGEIKKLLLQLSEDEKQKRKVEIDFLQAQMNPHFISNTLNTIIWMAKMRDADNIAALTKSLNSLMQSSMRRGSAFIPVGDEIAYTKNYVEIQKYSAFYDFEIEFIVNENMDSLYTPGFILQPLVENAIIHGISEEKDNHRIEVSVFRNSAYLQMEVFDNGKGMKQSHIEERTAAKNKASSIGIKNIQERIRLLFGEKYGLVFESKENSYTKAIVMLPLLTASEPEINNGQ
jgi:two-component system sensor histidine kinase YesM